MDAFGMNHEAESAIVERGPYGEKRELKGGFERMFTDWENEPEGDDSSPDKEKDMARTLPC